MTTNADYDRLLRESAVLKLQARRESAIGDAVKAAVLFREAADRELAALDLLDRSSPQVIAGARVEAAGLLMEAGCAGEAVKQLLAIPSAVRMSPSGEAMLTRLLDAAPALRRLAVCPRCDDVVPLARGCEGQCSCGRRMDTL